MRVMSGRYSALILLACWAFTAVGNNLRVTNTMVVVNTMRVTNAVVATYPPAAGLARIRFDIAWDNSWRYTNVNHDAAWVFFKVQQEGMTNWTHVKLEGAGTNPPGYSTGTGTGIELIVPDDGVGVFVRRSAEGSGAMSASNVRVAWNFISNGLTRISKVKIQTLAIEMVYVPQGAFSLGSGGSGVGEFYKYPNTNATYAITNEDAITVGTNAGNLYYGDLPWGQDRGTNVPAAFPKGYKAFYCMKYEMTHGQYMDFLNLLTRAQQNNRTSSQATTNWAMWGTWDPTEHNDIRCPALIPDAPTNIVFGCDANSNMVFNESNDALDRSCNYTSWPDGAAFADWAGLRPMTEFEYEKACRGTNTPVPNEYAWGTTNITCPTAIVNLGTGIETATPATANCYANYGTGRMQVRVGLFATANSTREAAGASWWGIMDLSGNVYDRMVGVSIASGRSFTGLMGDGTLDANGNANVPSWPPTSEANACYRGGAININQTRLSDRNLAGYVQSFRRRDFGGRAVRTAPLGVGP